MYYFFVTDVNDIDKHFPGLMKATIEWFKIYKIPDGKPENQFAFNGETKSRDFALHVIEEVHQHWTNLVKREKPAGGIAWFVLSITLTSAIDYFPHNTKFYAFMNYYMLLQVITLFSKSYDSDIRPSSILFICSIGHEYETISLAFHRKNMLVFYICLLAKSTQ